MFPCFIREMPALTRSGAVTDDAMVVETMLGVPVKLVKASYDNIKITTPEDIRTAESICADRAGTAENRSTKMRQNG